MFGFEIYLEIGLWKFESRTSPEKLNTGTADRTNALLESPGRATGAKRRSPLGKIPALPATTQRRCKNKSRPSVNAIQLASMMLSDTPTVPQMRSPSVCTMDTRVFAAVATSPSMIRTL
jgi:hypothetical protein